MRTLVVTLTALATLSACAAPLDPEADPVEEAPADVPETTTEDLEVEPVEGLLPHGLHFVLTGPEQAFVVLSASPPEDLDLGPIELVSEGPESSEVQSLRVVLAAESDADSERRARVLADRLVLFGHAGELCRVAPDDLGVLRRAGFEASYAWREKRQAGTSDLEEAWELGESGALLVARVGALPAACKGAVWAITELSSVPRTFSPEAQSDPSLAARALASFRELPEHVAIQLEYREPSSDSDLPVVHAGWWDSFEGARPTSKQFREATTGRRLVLVNAAAGAGCGEFGASLWALFEQRPNGLAVRAVGQDDTPPTDVVDADGDGSFELFSGERASFVSDAERVQVDVSVPFTGCGC